MQITLLLKSVTLQTQKVDYNSLYGSMELAGVILSKDHSHLFLSINLRSQNCIISFVT